MLKKVIQTLLIVILLSLTFNGCTPKIETVTVYEKEYVCNKQSIYEKPKLNIFIAKEDYNNAIKFKELNDLAYTNYENQVLENNKLCDKYTKVK